MIETLRYIREHPGANTTDVMQMSREGVKSRYHRLDDLVAYKLATVQYGETRKQGHRYTLTGLGHEIYDMIIAMDRLCQESDEHNRPMEVLADE